MLYITLTLAANIVFYKLFIISSIVMSVGSFVIPCVHILLDVITECYGFSLAKKIILYGLACQLIFSLICIFLISLPSPEFWHFQDSYNQVLGKLLRIFSGSFLGTLIGLSVNAKLISKWKILVKGKYFWMRSIGSSAIGQLIFSCITITYDMYGLQPARTILSILTASYIIKLVFTLIAAMPTAIIVSILNTYEKIPNYELDNNPFLNTNIVGSN
jgi:hypothetical protein